MPQNRASGPARRGIVDPRLSRYARATRSFIGASIGLGSLSALLIIAQAWLIAVRGRGCVRRPGPAAAVVGAVVPAAPSCWRARRSPGRAELVAGRSSTRVKQQLRAALLARVAALGPGRLREERTGEIATLATRGIDALDGYFSLYLPQLFLAVIVPVAVVAVVLASDWISALIIAVTLPLIPVFMALVGAATRDRTEAAAADAAAAGRPLPRCRSRVCRRSRCSGAAKRADRGDRRGHRASPRRRRWRR